MLGSPKEGKQPGHLFSTMDLFFQAFQDAVSMNRKKREDEERRVRMEKAREVDKIKRSEMKELRDRERERERECQVVLTDGVDMDVDVGVDVDADVDAGDIPNKDEKNEGEDSMTPTSLVSSRKNEAKEMMKRFSVIAESTQHDTDHDTDTDTDTDEDTRLSPAPYNNEIVGREIVLDEDLYDGGDQWDDEPNDRHGSGGGGRFDGSSGSGRDRGRDRDRDRDMSRVCSVCFMVVDECEC